MMTTNITKNEYQRDIDDEDSSSLSSSNSDSSDACPFNPDIAAKLSAAFSKATGIDLDIAVDLLNVHGWNIDQALAATYEAKEKAESLIITKENYQETKENYFKILSWNADLPDNDDEDEDTNELIEQKVETMVEILLREQPQIILLQHVGTFALTLIITSLASVYQDESIQIDPSQNPNYISIFTRKSDIEKSNVSIIQHQNQWQMLKVEIVYKNSIHLDLFNAYLDEHSSEELVQFCFDQINQKSNDHLVLSGISANISENQWNTRPTHLVDIWESIGKPSETSFTFDPSLNSNIEGNSRGRRDDRLFLRSSTSSSKTLIKAIHLEFEGLQRLKTSNIQYPSTHWALQAYLDLQKCNHE